MALRVRCSCPIRTSSAAIWSLSIPRARPKRWHRGAIRSVCPIRSGPTASPRLPIIGSAGFADMVQAIAGKPQAALRLRGWPCTGVDIMTSILKAAETGSVIELTTTCARPMPPVARRRAGAAQIALRHRVRAPQPQPGPRQRGPVFVSGGRGRGRKSARFRAARQGPGASTQAKHINDVNVYSWPKHC